MRATASAPLEHSPRSTIPGSAMRKFRKRSRARGSSSTIKVLIGVTIVAKLRKNCGFVHSRESVHRSEIVAFTVFLFYCGDALLLILRTTTLQRTFPTHETSILFDSLSSRDCQRGAGYWM